MEKSGGQAVSQARRETWAILIGWTVFAVWVIGFAAARAYVPPDKEVEILFGLPSWVFWGVALPWVFANGFTFWWCCFYFQDEDWSGEGEEEGKR
ncbi:MAG: DUF997 family protein [Verrucomicrobiota bacterium]